MNEILPKGASEMEDHRNEMTNILDSSEENKIPQSVILAVILISIAPYLLMQLGMDFSSPIYELNRDEFPGLSVQEPLDSSFRKLSGTLHHTILEWTAVCAAIFTVLFSFVHFRLTREITMPIIGIALFCAGCMDAFHTLAADRLIDAIADNRNLIPFTWAISRTFNALILIFGITILLKGREYHPKADMGFIIFCGVIFLSCAYWIISFCATQQNLPQTMYPEAMITRPWDVGPLLLYLFALIYLFPLYYKRYPSVFVHSLIISMVPAIVTELHMAFGSDRLFDGHFNAAHFLKIIAYLLPLLGLLMSYIDIYTKHDISEKLRKLIFNAAPNGMIMVDAGGKIVMVNSTMTKLFGYEQHELVGQSIELLVPHDNRDQHSDHRQSFAVKPKLRPMDSGLELYGQRKDGSKIPVEIGLNPIETPDGMKIISSIVDISDRKNAMRELRKHTQELEASNKELEQFAYVASHDLQEPLRMVASFTELLAKKYANKLDDKALEYIAYASDGARRMQSLINALLEYSRLGQTKTPFKDVDCEDVVREALANLAIAIKESEAEIIINKLPRLSGDQVQLQLLFQNLIGNAIKYRSTERKIQVVVSAQEKKDSVVFSVTDNGIGIKSTFFERIFVIFQRLHGKTEYSGTGIGLAHCRKIVERHGGKIHVESEEDKGSTFSFSLLRTQFS